MSNSREALERLIAERLEPHADREKIDAHILERFEETWAIVFTDLVGFSRRTREFGIVHFLSVIYKKGLLMKPIVEEYDGTIVKEEADSWLILFRRPERALECLIDCNRACERYNDGRAEEDRVQLCAGLGYGAMLKIGDEDVWGKEVNFASKLGEDVAAHKEILLTESAEQAVRGKVTGLSFERDSFDFGSMDLAYYRTKYNL